jgi:TfoX/Sxy family transcriptional regulator of competence genes
MAHDEELAKRIRELLGDRDDLTEVRMFGGLAWLVNGNMAVVARGKGGLLVRVDPAEHDDLLAEDGTATMVMRGRPMRGWMTVEPQACATAEQLTPWVRRGLAYALTLPPK